MQMTIWKLLILSENGKMLKVMLYIKQADNFIAILSD